MTPTSPQNAYFNQMIPLFIQVFAALPIETRDLFPLLVPFLQAEEELRRLFVQQPRPSVLDDDPYVGLVELFSAPEELRKTRCRLPVYFHFMTDAHFYDLYRSYREGGWALSAKAVQDFFDHHIFALPPSVRRVRGSLCTVACMDAFEDRWRAFTFGLFKNMDWENVVAAGGSVQACLQPFFVEDFGHLYHESAAYRKSDVDLFLWGLNEAQALEKMESIYRAIKSAVQWDTVCIRKRNVVSIHTRFPFRTVQIILRLYGSPSEILAGFDVDCACVAYDGCKIFASPRAVVAMMTQCNTVDVTRRSPSYEARLRKYADRGFEVFVPDLNRSRVDPKIYSFSPGSIPRGLARLLVLEDMRDSRKRYDLFNLLCAQSSNPTTGEKTAIANLLDINNYDPSVFSIPYGPAWNASRIRRFCAALEEKFAVYGLVREVKSSSNGQGESTSEILWDSKPEFHRHLFLWADTMEACLRSVCDLESCPQSDEEWEKGKYLPPGPVQFMTTNPGRQLLTGSFNPIDNTDWEREAYGC